MLHFVERYIMQLAVLSSMVLAVLLVIGGVEQNPGPVVEVQNTDFYVPGVAGI